jgi:hypothetical protein
MTTAVGLAIICDLLIEAKSKFVSRLRVKASVASHFALRVIVVHLLFSLGLFLLWAAVKGECKDSLAKIFQKQ